MTVLAAALAGVGLHVEIRDTCDRSSYPADLALLVVDAYSLRADSFRSQLSDGCALVAVEDLGRDLDVDLLVDPAPWPTDSPYSAPTRTLVGLRYALVAPPGLTPVAVTDRVERVLVTAGGRDVAGIGARVASRVARALPGVEVVHAAGPWSAVLPAPGVRSLRSADGLGSELVQSDLVVTAGGVTMLEALVCGRPTVVLPTADNQARQVAGVAAAAAAVVVPAGDEEAAVDAAVGISADADWRRRLAASGQELVDGHGPERVADVISDLG